MESKQQVWLQITGISPFTRRVSVRGDRLHRYQITWDQSIWIGKFHKPKWRCCLPTEKNIFWGAMVPTFHLFPESLPSTNVKWSLHIILTEGGQTGPLSHSDPSVILIYIVEMWPKAYYRSSLQSKGSCLSSWPRDVGLSWDAARKAKLRIQISGPLGQSPLVISF